MPISLHNVSGLAIEYGLPAGCGSRPQMSQDGVLSRLRQTEGGGQQRPGKFANGKMKVSTLPGLGLDPPTSIT